MLWNLPTNNPLPLPVFKQQISHCTLNTYGIPEVQLHAFLNSAVYGSQWSASSSDRFNPTERKPNTQSIGIWLGPRAGLLNV